MEHPPNSNSEAILIALRRVTRAIDLHSRHLAQSHGLTTPQAIILLTILRHGPLTSGELATRINLSPATVTDIINRLAQRQLVERQRDPHDRRRVHIHATPKAAERLACAPPLLQQRFVERFEALRPWEQNLLLSSLQRIAELMDAEELDASPLLTSEPLAESPTPPNRATIPPSADSDRSKPK